VDGSRSLRSFSKDFKGNLRAIPVADNGEDGAGKSTHLKRVGLYVGHGSTSRHISAIVNGAALTHYLYFT